MQNKTFYILLMMLSFITISCGKENNFQNISTYQLEILGNESCSNVYILIPVNKEEDLIVINEAFKDVIYEQYYKNEYTTYYSFLEKLYKREIKNLHKYIKEGFRYDNTDKQIFQEYKNEGIDYVIDKYLNKIEGIYYLKEQTQNAIIQILFINGYYIYFNDYSGWYSFSKDCIH